MKKKISNFFVAIVAGLTVSFWPSSSLAETGVSVSTFGPPPNFLKYLYSFDQKSLFSRDGQVYLGIEADVVVVFVKDREDDEFFPAGLYRAFSSVTQAVDSFIYVIRGSVFGAEYDAEIVLVLADNMEKQLSKITGNPIDRDDVQLFSCLSAGVVWNNMPAELNERVLYDVELLEHCQRQLAGS